MLPLCALPAAGSYECIARVLAVTLWFNPTFYEFIKSDGISHYMLVIFVHPRKELSLFFASFASFAREKRLL
jgi:hypothetical protein